MRRRWFGRIALLGVATLSGAAPAAAQTTSTLHGQVTDTNGTPLAGAQVAVIQESTGSRRVVPTGADGRYRLEGLRAGAPYRVEAQMLGYGTEIRALTGLVPGGSRQVDFVLGSQAVALDAIEIFAERAVERRTPVAYSNVPKAQIQTQLGSRDIPLILNVTPSVYATAQGGGAGDARLNVRGFSQRNVAVMVNGVPINDMENGWVYWSNWDGIGDATSSIQLQRGLSAVNLATPSIGGTLNIVTDPAGMSEGVTLKQEVGNDGFLKTTLVGSTGLVDGRYALTAAGVRKRSDGLVQGTWTDAWAYYLAGSFIADDRNRFDLFAIGAPQRHGQNLYKQNIGAYSHAFAQDLDDYDPAALERFREAGRSYNQNYNVLTLRYDGKQAVGDDTFSRYSDGFLNERENFYHKPQVNLNWYSELSDRLLLSTVGYFSGGEGGGTGTAGSMRWNTSGPSRIVDWDATILRNQESTTGSLGILRNSRNNQWTVGAISKLEIDVSEPLRVELGVDWRTAEIEHYYEIRDLLGGEYYHSDDSEFWPAEGMRLGLGDRFNYDFTNTVDWLGTFAQSELVTGPLSAYGMAGVSTIQYGYTNHFKRGPGGGELTADTDRIWGYQVKGGGLYNLTDELGVFANAGYVSKVPIFDAVIDDVGGQVNPDPANETFVSLEAGVSYRAAALPFAARLNVYRTTWKDRTLTRGVVLSDGTEGLVNLTGMDALHQGIELDASYQPVERLRLDAAASFGDWRYTDDVGGTYRPDDRSQEVEAYHFYVKDLKVGDAPQTQFSYAASVYPVDGLSLQLVGKSFARHFAEFDPFGRTDPNDRTQSWRAPGYTVFDLHAGLDLPVPGSRVGARLFANVFNLFDELYVQDAVDNSAFNGFDMDHDADDAEVYLGLPRTFNLGVSLSF